MSIDVTINYGVFGDVETNFTANTREAKQAFAARFGFATAGFSCRKSYTQEYMDWLDSQGLCYNMEFKKQELN